MRGGICALVLLTTGCGEVVDFEGYSFPEPTKACDGSPAFTDPKGDGSLTLSGNESLGFPAELSFSSVCMLGRARLNMCGDDGTIKLASAHNSTIGGEGILPLDGFDAEFATLGVEAPLGGDLTIVVGVERRRVLLTVNAPDSDVTIVGVGFNELEVNVVARDVRVVATEFLHLLDVQANSLQAAAVVVFIDERSFIPDNSSIVENYPGVLEVEACL